MSAAGKFFMDTGPKRKSPRLQGHDYSQAGVYFVTICTHQRQRVFGEVQAEKMVLNASGEIAHDELQKIAGYWDDVNVDLWVVMPNHVHVIIIIHDTTVGTAFLPSAAPDAKNRVPTLGHIIGSYKSGVTRRLRQSQNLPEWVVWQKRYHDHIIRSSDDLDRIRQYVLHNPELWAEDIFFNEISNR